MLVTARGHRVSGFWAGLQRWVSRSSLSAAGSTDSPRAPTRYHSDLEALLAAARQVLEQAEFNVAETSYQAGAEAGMTSTTTTVEASASMRASLIPLRGELVAEPPADEGKDPHQSLGRLDGGECALVRGEQHR